MAYEYRDYEMERREMELRRREDAEDERRGPEIRPQEKAKRKAFDKAEEKPGKKMKTPHRHPHGERSANPINQLFQLRFYSNTYLHPLRKARGPCNPKYPPLRQMLLGLLLFQAMQGGLYTSQEILRSCQHAATAQYNHCST